MGKQGTQTDPPNADELELSVFGPGVGECLVIHLGFNDWMVVDSCLYEPNGRSIALHYFDLLKLDVSQCVKLVVVTHWHDDHIRGISSMLREATAARLVFSAALRNSEFQSLIASGSQMHFVSHTSGVAEFANLLEIQRERATGRYNIARGPDVWATEGTRLFHRDSPTEIAVWALSPSAQTLTDAHLQIGKLIPKLGDQMNPYPSLTPNGQSIVLRVDAPGASFLLGGDLEVGADEYRGWQSVVSSLHQGPVRGRAYKVAHHGSPTADHPAIWERLLAPSPHAVVTPYLRGKTPRPSKDDIDRLSGLAGFAHCTVWPLRWKTPDRRGPAAATMNRIARNRRALSRKPGHVRVRSPFQAEVRDLRIATFDGAGTIR